MRNEDLLDEDNRVTDYLEQTLRMMYLYKNEGKHLFDAWLNKFEYTANIIGVPNNKMLELFNKMVDNDVHRCVKETYPFLNFNDLSYEDMTKYYLNILSKSKEIDSYRKRLEYRNQYEGETIEKYADNLDKLIDKCNFGRNRDEILYKRFLKGIRDKEIRKYFNKTVGLSFKKMLAMASEFEKGNFISYYIEQALSKMNIYDSKRKGDFCDWLNQFEYVANSIEVPNEKMIDFFNNMVHHDVHMSVKKLYPFFNFYQLSYEQIAEHYYLVFAPSHEVDLNKKRFISRKQYKNESILEYSDSLRKIYKKCYYTSNLEERLCKQFIKGVLNNELRRHLRQTPILTFNEMVEKAIEFGKDSLIQYYVDEALYVIHIYDLKMKVDFCDWINKFEYLADTMEVPRNKLIEFFQNMVDSDVHKRFNETYPFLNFSQLSYTEIINYYFNMLSKYKEFSPYRIRFRFRYQYGDETIEKYVDNLQKLYQKCCYKQSNDETLCKQFLKGIRSHKMRIYLREFSSSLSFEIMATKAIEFESNRLNRYYVDFTLSKINNYDPKKEVDFCDWLNKFEYVTNSLKITNKKMLELFNKMIDNDVHTCVIKSYPTVNFSELSYEEITKNYLNTLSKSTEIDSYRKRLQYRNQYEEETIEKYADNLKKLMKKCNFVGNPKVILCKQFINGVRNNELRKCLKETTSLSFNEMIANAVHFEESNLIQYYLNQTLLIIPIYNPEKEGDFCDWLNKFEYVANSIEIPNEKMIDLFNNMMDNYVHTCVKKTYPLINFHELTYEQIIEHYYLVCAPSHEVESLNKRRLISRKQYDKESILEYSDSLRKIYNMCSCTDRVEKQLCEQFINGIRNDELKKYLREIPNLSFNKTVEKALKFEKNSLIRYYLDQALCKMNTYRSEKETDFCNWLNKFDYVANSIRVSDNIMIEFFMNMVDSDVHTRFKDTYPYINLSKCSYEEIINHYLHMLSRYKESNLHRRRFRFRKQYEDEIIEKYADNLQRLYKKCCYTQLNDERLCKKFINGMLDQKLKTYLRELPCLSFNIALTNAIKFVKYNSKCSD